MEHAVGEGEAREGKWGEDEDGTEVRCTKGSLYHLTSVTNFWFS